MNILNIYALYTLILDPFSPNHTAKCLEQEVLSAESSVKLVTESPVSQSQLRLYRCVVDNTN